MIGPEHSALENNTARMRRLVRQVWRSQQLEQVEEGEGEGECCCFTSALAADSSSPPTTVLATFAAAAAAAAAAAPSPSGPSRGVVAASEPYTGGDGGGDGDGGDSP